MSISAEDRLGIHAGGLNDPDPEVPERAKRRSYRARYKLEVLAEYETLDREGKGGLLRREGLYSSLISSGVSNATRVPSRRWRRSRAGHRSIRLSGTAPDCVSVSGASRKSCGRHVGGSRCRGNSQRCWRNSPPIAPTRPVASRIERRRHLRVGSVGGCHRGVYGSGPAPCYALPLASQKPRPGETRKDANTPTSGAGRR